MAGRLLLLTRHNSTLAPTTLSEELLLASFILVRRDRAQPPLAPIYESPYRVLEQSSQPISFFCTAAAQGAPH